MPDDDGIMSRDDAKISDDAAAGIISADDGLKFIAACKKGYQIQQLPSSIIANHNYTGYECAT